ncbi:MAG: DNA mismatch repair endonuclease MutL [Candidatus Babeliaceae bacterium]
MGKIKQLTSHEAQKIAAGEVVERPANVVKELIENALDAHATEITIFIEEGGKKLIRIIDNGSGMSAEDAHMSIVYHATSKITRIDDLPFLTTFGFRGEALSSISAVSMMTLVTQEAKSSAGIRLVIEQGTIVHEEIAGGNQGTDITIQDLFYNVPVRKKFLKTRDTEWRAILHFFQAICLAYPQVHFKLYHDQHIIHLCPPAKMLSERIMQLFGTSITEKLIVLDEHQEEGNACTVSGTLTQPHYQRYDRSGMFFFVNKRWVKNHKLGQAVLKGYANSLLAGKFPAVCIFLTIDSQVIDINIHPRKEEVQFLHPRKIEIMLEALTKKALEQCVKEQLYATRTHALINRPEVFSSNAGQAFPDEISSVQAHEIIEQHFQHKMPFNRPLTTFESPQIMTAGTLSASAPLQTPVFITPSLQLSSTVITEEVLSTFHIIGQLHKTYILLEASQGLLLVDQHAAHERILYELFAHRFHEVACVPLLFPSILTLSAADYELIASHLTVLETYGIKLETVGQQQLALSSLPVPLKNISAHEIVHAILMVLTEYMKETADSLFKKLHHALQTQMACKAAVKAGDELSTAHMQELINLLIKTENRLTCPHGRPTIWNITLDEIERKFKRK